MTEKQKARWWAAVPRTTVEHEDNVVHMPRPTLDDIERAVADAQNAVIAQQIECERAMIAYKTALKSLEDARHRMAERLKESGAKVEFVTKFPEIDDAE